MAYQTIAKKEVSPRAAYWRGMVKKWRRSGQTPEAFCRQRHLKAGTFAWWRPRLAKAQERWPCVGGSVVVGFCGGAATEGQSSRRIDAV